MANAYQLISIEQVDGLAAALEASQILAALLTVDGPNSLLNADLLDGYSSDNFVFTSAYTAADVLAKLLTVDGAGSNVDADTLDGYHASSFVLAGASYVNSFNGRTGAVTLASLDVTNALGFTPLNAATYTAADVLAKLLTVDGAGSNVDADTLDGYHASSFVLSGSTYVNSFNGRTGVVTLTSGDVTTALGFTPLNATAYTAADVLSKLLTVDGSGSNLDADFFDGYDSTAFPRKAENAAISGTWAFDNGITISSIWRFDDASGIMSWGSGYGQGIMSWDTNLAILGAQSGSALALWAGGAERARILTSGNFGIGTSSPQDKLHVVGGDASTLRIDNTGQQYTSVDWYNNNSSKATIYYDNVGAEFVTRTTTSAGIGFDTNLTRRVTISPGGSVGIGINSPGAKLDVSGSIQTTQGSGGTITAYDNDAVRNQRLIMGANANGSFLNSTYSSGGTGSLNFMTINYERLRITEDGNVGIGTTSPGSILSIAGAGGIRFTAGGTYSEPAINSGILSYDSVGGQLTLSARSSGGSTYISLFTSSSGTGAEKARLTSAGRLGLGTTTPKTRLDLGSAGGFTVTQNPGSQTTLDYTGFAHNDLIQGSYVDGSGYSIHVTSFGHIADPGRKYQIGSANSSTFAGATFVPHLTILADGKTGIGTATPSQKLDVTGTIAASGDVRAPIFYDSNNTAYYLDAANTSTSMVVAGSVGIGTTSPGAKLTVVKAGDYNSEGNVGIRILSTASSANVSLHLGTDTTNNIGFIQAMHPLTSWSTRALVLQGNGGNVGIGTTAPSGALDVTTGLSGYAFIGGTTGNGSHRGVKIGQSSGGYSVIQGILRGALGATDLALQPEGGYVGIGTLSPSTHLELYSSAAAITLSPSAYAGSYRTVLGTTAGAMGILQFGNNGGNQIRFGHSAAGGAGSIYVNNTVDYTSATDGTLAMHFASNGNVGVGTASPATSLDLYRAGTSTIRMSSVNGAYFTDFINAVDSANSFRIQHNGVDLLHATSQGYENLALGTGGYTFNSSYANAYVSIKTASTERLRIDSSGRLLVGQTSALNNGTIDVLGTGRQAIVARVTDNVNSLFQGFNAASALSVQIDGSGNGYFAGNVGIGTTSPTQKLHVDGRVMVTNSGYTANPVGGVLGYYSGGGTPQTYLQAPAGGEVVIWDDATAQIAVFRDNGNVGIGTASPAHKLTVTGGHLAVESGSAYLASSYSLQFNYGVDNNYYITKSGTNLYLNTGGTFAMMSGNVGIGTVSPTSTLQINYSNPANVPAAGAGGHAFAAGAAGYGLAIGARTNGDAYLQATRWDGLTTNYNMLLQPNGGNVLINRTSYSGYGKLNVDGGADFTNGNVLMCRDSGYVGIGTASPGTVRLRVLGVNGDWASYLSGNATTSQSYGVLIDAGTNQSDSAFRIRSYGGADYMHVRGDGCVGIGTASPGSTEKLTVIQSSVYALGLWNLTTGNVRGITFQTGTGTQGIHTNYGGSGVSSALILGCYTNRADQLVLAEGGNVGIGTTSPGYKLEVVGSFAATTKSFVIDHPTKPDMKLRYGSLEGPENGVYVRGRLTTNTIELPDYWTGLVDEDTITVNLTPIGKRQDLYVESIADNKIIVGGENINCFYTVFAERKDVEKLEVEFACEH